MDIITGILTQTYFLLNKMAPYLIFGFLFAGVLHIFVKTATISRHLGGNNFVSVIKAALFGIPLPLCSCSVIPAAMSLKKEGASKGAVLSFLISTPTTGVDSIFATYSLLGGLFTAYRILASFITGTVAGVAANLLLKDGEVEKKTEEECKLCKTDGAHEHSAPQKIKGVFTYAFGDLLEDTGVAILAGILIGGAIIYFIPEGFIETYLGAGFKSMLVMLIVGIPMYVCATASIPIAAALMIRGMDPGAAFVFLVAGPATNVITMSVIAKNIGYKALGIYLGSIILCSIGMGVALNKIYYYFYEGKVSFMVHQHELIPSWAGIVCGIVLCAFIAYNLVRKKFFSPSSIIKER
ncbi:SO_0444 family Cu/Zn efflux transporter [Candidatus Omnitrophota bacterium]